MALFGTKKNTKKVESKEVAAPKVVNDSAPESLAHIIKRPRITEKASVNAEKGVYAFDVAAEATKISIANAIRGLYKVSPVKVAILHTPSKKVFVKGKWGIKKGGKKAYVYLKKGDVIEFV